MPVNMNPKKRIGHKEPAEPAQKAEEPKDSTPTPAKNPDEPTEADLAQKEEQHLWEETEVIDMDKW